MIYSTPGFPISWSLLKLISIELVMTSNHLILCLPNPLHMLQSFPASGSFPMNWLFTSCGQSFGASASASVIPMNIQGWFPLGLTDLTLKSLHQHCNLIASILQHSAFFIVQLSHLYMTTGKTIALTIQTFACKVIFLLFSTLSRLVIAFPPRSKCLLISWLQILSIVVLEPNKIKSVTFPHFSPIYMPWNDGTGCHDLSSLNVEF